MAKLSKEEVKHVAHLARLAITEEEAEKFAEQLGKITDFAEQLNELDTTNVEPTITRITISKRNARRRSRARFTT